MSIPNGPQFRTIFKGYDPQQVDLAIADLTQQAAKAQSMVAAMEQSAKIQQSRATAAEKEIGTLRANLNEETAKRRQLEEANEKPWAALGEFAQKTQDEAKAQADNIIKEAQAKADRMVEEATGQANDLVNAAQADSDKRKRDTDAACARQVADAKRQSEAIIDSAKATANELAEKTDRETKEKVRLATEEADRQVARAHEATERYRGIAQMVDSLYRICIDRDGAPVMKPAPAKPAAARTATRPSRPARPESDPEATAIMEPVRTPTRPVDGERR